MKQKLKHESKWNIVLEICSAIKELFTLLSHFVSL